MEGSRQYFTVPACPVLNAVQELFFNTTPGNPLDPDLSICRYMLVADVLHAVCVAVQRIRQPAKLYGLDFSFNPKNMLFFSQRTQTITTFLVFGVEQSFWYLRSSPARDLFIFVIFSRISSPRGDLSYPYLWGGLHSTLTSPEAW